MEYAKERDCHPDYWTALKSLKNKPGVIINNDAVALEAGRGKGSIKKSRPEFAKLIAAIDDAAAAKTKKEREPEIRLEQSKVKEKDIEAKLQASYSREASLVMELLMLKKELMMLRKGKVLPLVRKGAGDSTADV